MTILTFLMGMSSLYLMAKIAPEGFFIRAGEWFQAKVDFVRDKLSSKKEKDDTRKGQDR